MIVYFLLLSVVAVVAYFFGSIGTLRLAGRFVFHQNLRRLGKGNVWLSNFLRVHKYKGLVLLTLVEIVKDLIPILIGGVLLGLKGQAEVGRAFAGFCMVMARLWPLFNRLSGCHGCVGLAVAGLLVDPSMGVAAAVVCAAGVWFSRYLSLGAVMGAAMMIITAILVVDNPISMALMIACAGLVVVRHIPALFRIAHGEEEKLSFREDLTYKLDQKF